MPSVFACYPVIVALISDDITEGDNHYFIVGALEQNENIIVLWVAGLIRQQVVGRHDYHQMRALMMRILARIGPTDCFRERRITRRRGNLDGACGVYRG